MKRYMTENKYLIDGFEIFNYLSIEEYQAIKIFSVKWITSLFSSNGLPFINAQSIETYHLNSNGCEEIHRSILKARNRHRVPPENIHNLLINSKLRKFLCKQGIDDFKLWDEGLGWLAFRLIRPGFGDGYPFSKKDWGPGKGTISIWVPILGFDTNQMIAFIRGSNKKEYEKFLPESSKFIADEFRLKDVVPESEVYRPKLNPGQGILFSPQIIHTEDVTKAETTRLSLEFRIIPGFYK